MCLQEQETMAVIDPTLVNYEDIGEELELGAESEESQEEEDDEDYEIIRAKWMFDGASTLDEVIAKLERHIEYIKSLKAEGYELTNTIDDDYGFIRQRKPPTVPATATAPVHVLQLPSVPATSAA
jgi:hypothetical protein